MTDPAESEFQDIEVEGGQTVAEVEMLPYWIVREQGVEGLSPRMVRSWVFEKVMMHDVPMTADTLGFMETAAQWLMHGTVEQVKLKVVSKPSASRPREE